MLQIAPTCSWPLLVLYCQVCAAPPLLVGALVGTPVALVGALEGALECEPVNAGALRHAPIATLPPFACSCTALRQPLHVLTCPEAGSYHHTCLLSLMLHSPRATPCTTVAQLVCEWRRWDGSHLARGPARVQAAPEALAMSQQAATALPPIHPPTERAVAEAAAGRV